MLGFQIQAVRIGPQAELRYSLPQPRSDAWLTRQDSHRLWHRFGGPVISVTVSLGVAEHRPDEDLAELIRRADTALYGAKEGGRNRVLCSRE